MVKDDEKKPLLRHHKSSYIELPRNECRYYDQEINELVEIFRTNIDKGLNSKQVSARLKQYGRNELPKPPPRSLLKIIFHQATDFMVLILLVSSIVSASIGDFIEAAVLMSVVLVNVVIGVTEEYRAEKALEELKDLTTPTAVIQRDGERDVIETTNLVPGDVAILEEGCCVPADLRLVEAVNLEIMEAVITGESAPVQKEVGKLPSRTPLAEQTNMAFMSTVVLKGRGVGIVVRTGKETEMGKISHSVVNQEEEETTALQQRLKKLGKILVLLSVVLCAAVSGIGFLRVWLKDHSISGAELKELVKIGISLAVSVIPEGLVAVVTVTMAFGVRNMARRNAIVRKLPAVETLGSVTVICTDKTGTLTEGTMSARKIWIGGSSFDITGNNHEGSFIKDNTENSPSELPDSLKEALKVLALCTNATVQKDPETDQWEYIGDPTEVALIIAAQKGGLMKEDLLRTHTFLQEIPFDSQRRMMSVVYRLSDGSSIVLAKGATDVIIRVCSHIIWDDKVLPMNQEFENEINRESDEMASNGLRVLALAHRHVDPHRTEKLVKTGQIERDMTFLGLVSLMDPPREGVKEAVATCRNAGITVIMLTGDHPRTGVYIAKQLGILGEGEEHMVMSGTEVDELSAEELASRQDQPKVFARVSPDHKKKIVSVLKRQNQVVAMTGDGVNDAPAIKMANVAIAMGGGTDLTKQVADIVLTDNNFKSIVAAIEEGRRIYDNIQKFVIYLLSCNSSEIYVMLIAVSAGLPVPFTPVMILWANLIIDVPPAVALGIDPAETDLLCRSPRDPSEGIFTRKTILLVLLHGFSMSGLTLAVYTLALYVEGYPKPSMVERELNEARSLAFVSLSAMQLWHSFLARSIRNSAFQRNLFNNYWLDVGVLLAFGLLVAASYIPVLKDVLQQYPLTGWDWMKIGICVVIHTLIVEALKFAFRWRARHRKHPVDNFYHDV